MGTTSCGFTLMGLTNTFTVKTVIKRTSVRTGKNSCLGCNLVHLLGHARNARNMRKLEQTSTVGHSSTVGQITNGYAKNVMYMKTSVVAGLGRVCRNIRTRIRRDAGG